MKPITLIILAPALAGLPNWFYYWRQALGINNELRYLSGYEGWGQTSNDCENIENIWMGIGQYGHCTPSFEPGQDRTPPFHHELTFINGYWYTYNHEVVHAVKNPHHCIIHGAYIIPLEDDSPDRDYTCNRDPVQEDRPDEFLWTGGWEEYFGSDPERAEWEETLVDEKTMELTTFGKESLDWGYPGSQWPQ